MVGFKLILLKVIFDVDNVVRELATTFDLTPPPVKYLIVKIVLDGEIP